MKKIKVSIAECRVGDVIAQDVFNVQTGAILWGIGHRLTKASLLLGKRFDCSDIYIAVDSWGAVWGVKDEELAAYEESSDQAKNMYTKVMATGEIELAAVKGIQEICQQNLGKGHTIMGCVNRIKDLDSYTYMHCLNVGMLASLIGKWLGFEKKRCDDLFLAGILHDIGKVKVDQDVLNKPTKLTPIEYKEVKKHVVYSKELVEGLEGLEEEVKEGICAHHERMDGSGYPIGLKGNAIPLFARIIAVADVYDAMLSERVYKPAETPFFVMETILRTEIDKLDADIVLKFLERIAAYYIGVEVKLSNGSIGEVVFIPPECIYRPIVKIGNQYINLAMRNDISIVDTIK